MQDSALARARPSSIAHAVYEAIKVIVTNYSLILQCFYC